MMDWLKRLIVVAGIGCALGPPCLAQCSPARPGTSPRVLVLALDGIPYRIVERAREEGAFEGWPETKPLLSTFPSMTNVAFTAMLRPFGLGPVDGYEVRHYDRERNKVVGGGLNYKAHMAPWRNRFHVVSRNLGTKVPQYTFGARSTVWKTLRKVERLVLESPEELMLAHAGGTDVMVHFGGEKTTVPLLLELSRQLAELKRRHLEASGRPLTLVLISDHGNAGQDIESGGGVRRRLRRAGLRVTRRLKGPDDVIAPMLGAISYGVLHLDPSRAETAARAVLSHPMIELAAWLAADAEVRVIGEEGAGVVRWRSGAGSRRFAYAHDPGDPLRLAPVLERLRAAGQLDAEGFAAQEDWFAHGALSDYPDAPRRLVDALTGTHVRHAATVIYSVAPGYAVGSRLARAGAWLKGGQIGTHGGLDRDSTVGFFLTDDPAPRPGPALRADRVLADWAHLAECAEVADLDTGERFRMRPRRPADATAAGR